MSNTQNKWVPVSERLPEDVRNPYLVLTDEGTTPGIAHLRNDVWFPRDSCNRIPNVTHWMDLPEPPKPADPFEAWADENTRSFPYFNTESCHAAWNASKMHYAKLKDYHRGFEDSVIAFESMVNRIMEGKDDGTGKLDIPELEKLRHVLLERLKPLPDFETWAKAHCADGPYLEVEKGGRLINERAAKIVWNAAQGKPEA